MATNLSRSLIKSEARSSANKARSVKYLGAESNPFSRAEDMKGFTQIDNFNWNPHTLLFAFIHTGKWFTLQRRLCLDAKIQATPINHICMGEWERETACDATCVMKKMCHSAHHKVHADAPGWARNLLKTIRRRCTRCGFADFLIACFSRWLFMCALLSFLCAPGVIESQSACE